MWVISILVGLVAATGVWTALEIIGHEAQMSTGLSVGVGVAVAALVGRWIEKRHVARERIERLFENN